MDSSGTFAIALAFSSEGARDSSVSELAEAASADGRPLFKPPRHLLAVDRVRHVGEPVAMVVAETVDQARDAVEAIEGQRLFQLISARVAWAAEARAFEQLPQYAPIKYAGHESGDFFLVPQG